MPDFYVSFNGFLKEDSRPDGWPRVVRNAAIYRADKADDLTGTLNEKAKTFQEAHGMNVTFDKGDLDKVRDWIRHASPDEPVSDPKFGNGFFIPMHMIAFINYTVRPIVGQVQEVTEAKTQ
jgi:hypothetical protein